MFPGSNVYLFTYTVGSRPRLVLFLNAATIPVHKQHRVPSLTEEVSEPWRLVVVNNGHTGSVEGHYAQDKPIEYLGFHHMTNRDAQEPLLVSEV